MIKLSVADYCQDCRYFEPVKIKSEDIHDAFGVYVKDDIEVVCENWAICRRVAKFTKNRIKYGLKGPDDVESVDE